MSAEAVLFVVLLVSTGAGLVALGATFGRSRCGHDLAVLSPPASLLYAPPIPFHPWRETHPDAIEVPLAVLAAYRDPSTVAWQARRDAAWREELKASIAEHGLLEPVELTIDGTGRARLSDGYHRVASLLEMGWPTAGVTFTSSQRLPKWGRPLAHLFTDTELARVCGWR